MKDVEELEKQRNRARKLNIILIIIIILLLFWYILLTYRIGKIGNKYKDTSSEPEEIIQEDKQDSEESKVPEILITQDDIEVTKDTQLNIFNNTEFNNKKIIAPHSKGTYNFLIQNNTNSDVIYNIKFNNEMQNFVNMKYKLKLDNIYVKGNKSEYITLDQMNLDDIVVLKNSTNIYTLEWYWDDNDELDTHVGSQEEDNYYTINLDIESAAYRK